MIYFVWGKPQAVLFWKAPLGLNQSCEPLIYSEKWSSSEGSIAPTIILHVDFTPPPPLFYSPEKRRKSSYPLCEFRS